MPDTVIPSTVLGEQAFFTLTDGAEQLEDLSPRERRLLVGALNFHALMAPERPLRVHLYDGTWESLPRTTDDSTFNGRSRAFRRRLLSFGIRSTVPPEDRSPSGAERQSEHLVAYPDRHLHVSRDAVLDFDPPRDTSTALKHRILRAVRAKMPLLYDEARDIELLRHRRSYMTAARRRRYEEEFEPGGPHSHAVIVPAAAPGAEARPAVIVGLHWFELGGAERWAFETIRLVKEAGFLPIVLTDRESHHPWITRPELDGAVVLPFSDYTARSQTPGVEPLLRALLRLFDVRGVVVHHNQWLYDRLHWLRISRPDLPITDSTHIVEYRGGGFPVRSVLVEEVITKHHVISPTLQRWMTDVQHVDPGKVVVAPLGGLTVTSGHLEFRERSADEPFTVVFVGRMARQKAPEVFVEMVHYARRRLPDARFVMHGDGDMSTWVDDIIRSEGLTDVIERRLSGVPVSATLDEAHVLVVPSHNEGLTLTTLEAVAHGVPVVSTDVGAQSDIVPPAGLVSRNVHLAARMLAAKVIELSEHEDLREALWRAERDKETQLLAVPSASEWFSTEVSTW